MLRKSLALLLLLSLLLLVLPARAQEPVVRFFVFYAQDCAHCQAVEEEVLIPLSQRYGEQIEVRRFDISVPQNYEVMLRLEGEYGFSASQIPAIFIGHEVLVGEEEIRARLERLVEEQLAAGGCDFPCPDTPLPAPTTIATPSVEPTLCPEESDVCPLPQGPPYPVVLAYFYQVGCIECDRVSYDLAYLEQKYPNLQVETFDLREHIGLNEALCERFGIPLECRLIAPAIFVGDDYLIGQEINAASLEALIEKYSQEESGAPWKEIQEQEAGASIIERFRSFTPLTVIGAGLLDGVNPCAFTTIIFFVSYLALMGRKGREVLLVGASFTAAVFLTYLLVGLGVLGFLQSLGVIKIFSRIIYLLAALLCFLLVALSLYDFYKIRRGRIEDISLKLPEALQRRVHQTIRERRKISGFISATFVTGFFVSLLELACTGQVYLPTIIFVTGVPELRGHAVAYLILYNLMFILPLVIVFLLTFYGTTSKQLTAFFRAQAGTVKLLTALLFAILGAWLILALI
ncbi:MAG TPA: hypothetical protein DCP08_00550 [Chloroflexi bacterium]|nr:hypothetical protein [Chloroflexota bacterium]